MLVKPSTPPPAPGPLQPSRSTVLNTPGATPDSVPAAPMTLESLEIPKFVTYNVPHVQLETDRITTPMAARLASSLLGHILFLKSQIPFPVVQMSRMLNMTSNSKAAKRRMELMNAMDTLASHLETTFIALSSAFARKESSEKQATDSRASERAHMLFVVGPSIGAARAKIALVFDGLEVKLAEKSADLRSWEPTREESSSTSDVEEDTVDSDEGGSDSSEDNGYTSSEVVDDEPGIANCGSDNGDSSETPPPASPSPSPSPTSSRSTTPLSDRPRLKPKPQFSSSSPSPLSTVLGPYKSRSMPPPNQTHAEEQNILRAADRLLSRTLANACADEESGGMSSELAPTQTHVLLRAPRRFTHPSWIPRQNLTKSLEDTLQTFTEDARSDSTHPTAQKKKPRLGVKTEGVWVSCRPPPSEEEHGEEKRGQESVKEEDDLIWWQWDGKIVGFSDW